MVTKVRSPISTPLFNTPSTSLVIFIWALALALTLGSKIREACLGLVSLLTTEVGISKQAAFPYVGGC